MSDLATANTRLEEIASEIESIHGLALLRIGERLAEAQDLFKYDRDQGGFTGWIENRLPSVGQRNAYRMVNVFRTFGASNVCQNDKLSKSVLYALAAPSTPESVREEAMQRAEAGEKIDVKLVEELKRKLKETENAALSSRSDVKMQKSLAQTAKDERDRFRTELDFAKSTIRQLSVEVEKLKEPGVIHVFPAQPTASEEVDVADASVLRTAAELMAERLDYDVEEIASLLRSAGVFSLAAELERARRPVRMTA